MIKFYGKTNPEYAFLSNFHPAPIKVDDQIYPTTEHYYQAMKTLDPEMHQRIKNASSPWRAKALGGKCQCRSDWEDVVGTAQLQTVFTDRHGIVVERLKDHLMYTALICKFTQHLTLRDGLLATGEEELVEASPSDYYWGCGAMGTGQNKLGRMLVLIRNVAINRIPI